MLTTRGIRTIVSKTVQEKSTIVALQAALSSCQHTSLHLRRLLQSFSCLQCIPAPIYECLVIPPHPLPKSQTLHHRKFPFALLFVDICCRTHHEPTIWQHVRGISE